MRTGISDILHGSSGPSPATIIAWANSFGPQPCGLALRVECLVS